MSGDDRSSAPEGDQVRFMQLVSMFQMAAMQHLGKLVNPMSNEVERDLDQARVSIDMLEMLKRRTEGNRSGVETDLLDKVLFELHMNYVDEVRAAKNEGDDAGEASEGDDSGADAPGERDGPDGGETTGNNDPDKQ